MVYFAHTSSIMWHCRNCRARLLLDSNYPRNRNLFGYLLAKLMERGGDILKDISTLLDQFGFDFTGNEVGGWGSVHLYIAEKKPASWVVMDSYIDTTRVVMGTSESCRPWARTTTRTTNTRLDLSSITDSRELSRSILAHANHSLQMRQFFWFKFSSRA